MKFFAPSNNWSMGSANSWWPSLGSVPTSAGVRVSEESALAFSAVFAGTRIISETLASLPLFVMEREDDRTTRKATDHPLWPLLHDAPNPEQDSMSAIDMQTSFQILWGNNFAEKQRDTVGEIKALWPIHPSRLPPSNIIRNPVNPRRWESIEVGQPGEWVFHIRNDDGTRTPIPASDMLLIPGVLSSNGITGVSIVMKGANAIGIGMATETHAGAYFKNGAVSNMAITSPKVVGKETAERLRTQWQKTFGGAQNHYKTLLLEEGMTPVPFSINPEASQLLASRQFSVTEIARLLRLPPHLLADLEHATFSNIEEQNISFVVHAMMPWIVRWERAMHRQLLSEEERKRYFFRFNVMGLLRGNTAARSQFYKTMFDMGALSPNDIRALEDMNPIDAGDQYFVPANNLMPLDKIGELAQAQIDKLNEPPPAPAIANPPEPDDVEDEPENIIDVVLAKIEERDTLDLERLAVRQQKASEAEESLREALRASIAARLVGLHEYEIRAAVDAAQKPSQFPTWQDDFYEKLSNKVTSALEPFVEPAAKLGFSFSPQIVALAYIRQSLDTFEQFHALPCDKLAPAVSEAVSGWTDRPARVAHTIIPKRTSQCAA